MPHRDPETGQFVATDDFEDFEQLTFDANIGVEASNLGGSTGYTGEQVLFDGVELVDYDELVDRNERLHLLEAHHLLVIYANSTSTEDGTVAGSVEISANPSRTPVTPVDASTSGIGGSNAVGTADNEDSIDLIGRPLSAVGHSPFSDTTNGMGGAGSAGRDEERLTGLPGVMAEFHPRDELFVSGGFRTWNIADQAVHLRLVGQHRYGVTVD